MEKYQEVTSELRELLKKVANSGIIAWTVGSKLHDIHKNGLYKEGKYSSFEKYTRAEFDKSPGTILAYIEIYKNFKEETIRQGDFLVTHLIAILDSTKHLDNQKILEGLQKVSKNVKFTAGNIQTLIATLSNQEDFNGDDVVAFLGAIVEEEKIARKEDRERKQRLFGMPIQCPGLPEIGGLFLHEPLNEMGTVALFCTMFSYLTKMPFELYPNRKERYLLVRIKWGCYNVS